MIFDTEQIGAITALSTGKLSALQEKHGEESTMRVVTLLATVHGACMAAGKDTVVIAAELIREILVDAKEKGIAPL